MNSFKFAKSRNFDFFSVNVLVFMQFTYFSPLAAILSGKRCLIRILIISLIAKYVSDMISEYLTPQLNKFYARKKNNSPIRWHRVATR